MGTNYYLHIKKPDQKVVTPMSFNTYHIGKSSYGWAFSLHVDEYEGVNSLQDLKNKILEAGENAIIQDEYENIFTLDELLSVILDRSWGNYCASEEVFKTSKHMFPDDSFTSTRHKIYKSMRRHTIDGRFCVGWSSEEETYDLIQGEFS